MDSSMAVRHLPLDDGRHLVEIDGEILTCVVCDKPLEHRNGACCHKCDPKWLKRHEGGKKNPGPVYDPQRKPWADKLADGMAMLDSAYDGDEGD